MGMLNQAKFKMFIAVARNLRDHSNNQIQEASCNPPPHELYFKEFPHHGELGGSNTVKKTAEAKLGPVWTSLASPKTKSNQPLKP